MTDARTSDTSPHASTAVRRALLDVLGVPAGQAVVVRRRVTDERDELVVRLAPSARPALRPNEFEGFPVHYGRLRAAVAG